MTVLLISIIVCLMLIVIPASYQRGKNIGIGQASAPKSIEYKHMHIWGKWEGHNVNIISPTTGRKLYTTSAQSRLCEDCGFKETKKITYR